MSYRRMFFLVILSMISFSAQAATRIVPADAKWKGVDLRVSKEGLQLGNARFKYLSEDQKWSYKARSSSELISAESEKELSLPSNVKVRFLPSMGHFESGDEDHEYGLMKISRGKANPLFFSSASAKDGSVSHEIQETNADNEVISNFEFQRLTTPDRAPASVKTKAEGNFVVDFSQVPGAYRGNGIEAAKKIGDSFNPEVNEEWGLGLLGSETHQE